MYKYEKRLKEAKELGIGLTDGQETYIKCAVMNSLNLMDTYYNSFVEEYAKNPDSMKPGEYLATLDVITSIMDFMDDNLVSLIDATVNFNSLQRKDK